MTRVTKLSLVTVVLCGAVLYGLGLALFRGYFDSGTYEMRKTKRSPTGHIAMLVERSDHEALNGKQYFVLVGDHIFSSAESRRALHSKSVLFSTDRDCLTLSWTASETLVVACDGVPITSTDINIQRYSSNNTRVSYVNIDSGVSGKKPDDSR